MAAFDSDTSREQRVWVTLVLVAAVTAISSSGVLVRGMDGATPLSIAAYRTLGAAALLAPSLRRAHLDLSRSDVARVLVAGIALALHFWTWFASLGLTTVLRSTVLVCTVPAFTAVFEWVAVGRRPSPGTWLGLGVALPGIAMLSG
ncbi:MAG: DMT family transporter, partial [Myxococcota bacterium]